MADPVTDAMDAMDDWAELRDALLFMKGLSEEKIFVFALLAYMCLRVIRCCCACATCDGQSSSRRTSPSPSPTDGYKRTNSITSASSVPTAAPSPSLHTGTSCPAIVAPCPCPCPTTCLITIDTHQTDPGKSAPGSYQPASAARGAGFYGSI